MFALETFEHRVLPVPFYILTLIGIWCPEGVKSCFRLIYSLFTALVIGLNIALTFQTVVYLTLLMRTEKFDLDAFFVLTSLAVGLFKGLNIIFARKQIKNLLMKGFSEPWKSPYDNYEKIMISDCVSEGRRIHLIYAVALPAGVLLKLLAPMLKSHSSMELPVPAWHPYDTGKFRYFLLSYTQQLFVGGTIIFMHIGSDTMISGLMLQSCLQLKLLQHRFKYLFHQTAHSRDISFKEKPEKESTMIKRCINEHHLIFRSLNKNFGGLLIALLAVGIPNICINVYYLSFSNIGLDVDFMVFLGLFSLSTFQIYLPCWYGNQVMLRSTEIVNAVYEMNWINLTPATRKAMIIIMLRASRPIRITSARIIPLDLKSFLQVIKLSYSVLNVLRHA